MKLGGIVLAAGAGTRFGAAKQLAPLDGAPLLQHAIDAQLSGGLRDVVVVLGARAGEVRAAIDPRGARVVVCEGWEDGMAASLRAGIAAHDGAEWMLVTLGDQPRIAPRAIALVAAAAGPGADAVRATYAGTPGHPVALGPAVLARAGELRGDEGARALLAGLTVRDVECGDLGAATDIDTPADLEALQA